MAWSEKEKQKREAGRPKIYTEELALKLCSYLSQGMSLKKTCEQEGMPSPSTVFSWMGKEEGFLELYDKAKQEAADAMAEEILDIADDVKTKDNNEIQKAKLRIDTRKFIMAKMKPKRYGDKLDLTSDGKPLPTPIYGGKSGKSANRTKK